MLRITERLAGRHLPQSHDRRDVAREYLVDLLPLVRVHLQQTANPLFLAAKAVQHLLAGLHVTG